LAEAQKLSAERCLELGLANRVVESTALSAETQVWAASLAARAPLALALTKRVARLANSVGFSEMLTIEAELQTFLAGTEDSREAITAFGDKRTPSFHGR
jgi:2-(1,2-epoxy-1,2-dihydrophenyl)acetyl-CoA isomerase